MKKIVIYVFVFCSILELTAHVGTYWRSKSNPSFGDVMKIRDDIGSKGKPYAKWQGICANKYGFNDSDSY